MRTLVRRLAVLTAAVLTTTVLAATAPATAVDASDANLAFSSNDLVVMPEGTCVKHPVTYAITLPAGADGKFTLMMDITGADGKQWNMVNLLSIQGAPLSGSTEIQFCDLLIDPGTYAVTSQLRWYDAKGFSNTHVGPTFNLQVVSKVDSQVTISAKRKGKKVTVSSVVSYRVTDWSPVAGGKVTVQAKVGKKWKNLKNATTDANGAISVKVKAPKKTLFRAKFAGVGTYSAVGTGFPVPGATSKSVRR